MAARTLTDLIEVVADRTTQYDFRMWGFGEGPALLALLRAGQRLHRPDLVDYVTDRVVRSFDTIAGPADHLISVEVLLELHRQRPSIDVSAAITRYLRAVVDANRPVHGQPAVHRPDLEKLASTIWVDCMHTDLPATALLGARDDSLALASEYCEKLQDDSGLFTHGYDIQTRKTNAVHWGRGQGWALHGLVAAPPSTATDRYLNRLLAALAQHEDNGSWRTIVDDSNAPTENSVSALMASAIYRLANEGRAAANDIAMAHRAMQVATDSVDHLGGLPVSGATPVSAREVYLDRPLGVWPWGQGPLLLALLEGETVP